MATPVSGLLLSFDETAERVRKGGVEIDVVRLGDMVVKRASYPKGWRFSKDMGAPRCLDTHVGYTVSGRIAVQLSDGSRLELGPGKVFAIPADHDAWVVGDEPCVIVQFDEGESAARRFNVGTQAAKAA
jgi:hypothetical protein